ncbi:MAG: RES family NAD+ phosphorylase [Flavobacteriales bacterium]|nr:RES family NAD+ phosphorylase [Flavobacteriales bacterium]
MVVYHIVREQYRNRLIPPLMNNRWNSDKHSVLYTSWCRSLACLEILVHKSGEALLQNYCTVLLSLPANVSLEEVKMSDLAKAWYRVGDESCRRFGEEWAHQQRSCVLKVPSSVVHGEFNFLINTNHPEFQKIKLLGPESFLFDKRLMRFN